MRKFGLAAIAAVLVLGMAGASGCSDDAFCYTCGQGGAQAAEAGPDVVADAVQDTLVLPDATEGGDADKTCPQGWADCNLFTFDGCEANLKTDVKNCGECSKACSLAHAVSSCKEGACAVDHCVGPDGGAGSWSDCNGEASDGCESNALTDSDNCGGCGKKCPAPPNSKAECVGGECGKITCDKGFADCNGNVTDGCEVELLNDPLNCGTCDKVCGSVLNGKGGCKDGVCGVGTCNAGYANCDQSNWSGCEVELATNVHHCGTCGKDCAGMPHGQPKCLNSTCLVDTCDPGYADCDEIPVNGCEANLASDTDNCAACGNACPDVANGVPGCAMFVCGIKSCNAGFQDCFGGASDGCETDTLNDVDHCGNCTTVCPMVADGFRDCVLGVCKIGSCDQDHADCNGVMADGCEAALETDVNNCGQCGTVCAPPPGGTAGCAGGQCGIGKCNAGYADCNQDILDGCEFDITNDWQNCGGCNVKCGSKQCQNSKCVCTQSVLLIPDESTQGSATLAGALGTLLGAGWTVTTATKPSHLYDGASPAPTGFGAVVLLAGGPGTASYSIDMPSGGQQALAAYVQASNGLVLTEWAAKHVADGRWQTLSPLVLLGRTVAFSGQVTYKLDPGFAGHPLWDGLQNSFLFASTSNVGLTKVATGVKRIAGSPEAIDAVAIRELPSEGRVVHVAHAGNYAPNGWSNTNIQRLVANAVRWTARCN